MLFDTLLKVSPFEEEKRKEEEEKKKAEKEKEVSKKKCFVLMTDIRPRISKILKYLLVFQVL